MKLSDDVIQTIADACESKADAIDAGFYGEEDDDESWAADLRHAAEHLRAREFWLLTDAQIEEMSFACGDCDDDVLATIEAEREVQS